MANNEIASASNIADLFTKLSTFAVAAGWTQDYAASDRLFLHKGSCYVAFRWAASSPTGAGIYQALGFINSGTDPGSHTNDSGQGAISGTNATIMAGRSVPLVNSTMPYWFFTDGSNYVHVVVQVAGGDFRHFGFGSLDKIGTWTGGEYSYGHLVTVTTGTRAINGDSTVILDALAGIATGSPGASATATVQPFAASLHIESAPNQSGSSKWALAWGGGTPSSNDRGGNSRANVQGGFRGGPTAVAFGRFTGTLLTGLVPMYTIPQYYKDPSNARYYPIGLMHDVRGCRMDAFVGGQEVSIASDTWIVFPAKALATFGASNTGMQGIAYKKIP